jgi:hypothetical protein
MVKYLYDNNSIIAGKENGVLLPEDQARKLLSELTTLMEVQKYYLNPFISADDVALKLNVHRNVISYVVNNFAGMHFRDFLNEYRLLEVDLLLNEKNVKSVTGAGSMIVESAGFFSMSTYYRARKKRSQRSCRHEDCKYYHYHAGKPS